MATIERRLEALEASHTDIEERNIILVSFGVDDSGVNVASIAHDELHRDDGETVEQFKARAIALAKSKRGPFSVPVVVLSTR